uniref:CAP N-terminal domain-containing protein n=1 Tax=Hanusia phi TaxID=3032 RepID=A0A7S0HB94_9CRYP|mmetsp:Transcript_14825/g.34067  ORF Transcript_14825/g.34067 Transcript_14825/m.34067 type:complete len:516 (+) Transcript_14825:34-1581(+)
MSSPRQAEEGSLDEEDDPLMEGDPFVHIIDRVDAIKNSFSTFYQTWKDEGFPDEITQEDIKDQISEKSNGQLEKIEKMTDKFANILGRFSDLVKQMEMDDDGCYDTMEEVDENEEEEDDEEDEEAPCETVLQFEDLITNCLVPFLDAVNSIGGEVQQQGRYVAQAFGAQREMLMQVSRGHQPEQEDDFKELLQGTNEALGFIDHINDEAVNYRKHTAMIAGAMTAMGWITSPEPRQYIGDMLNAVPVYGRQIVEEYPGEEHKNLVHTLKLLLRGLQEYVTKFHPRGLSWNSKFDKNNETEKKLASYATHDKEAKMDHNLMFAAYDQFILENVVPFIKSAYKLEQQDIISQADFVQKAFKSQRDFMKVVSMCKRPSDDEIRELLVDTSEFLMEIEEKCDMESDNRHHLTLVSSGMPCLAWVSVPMNPSGYISDMINSIPVYGDKIVKSTSSSDNAEDHAEFVKTFRDMLRGLNDYVKTYHSKGLSWNMDGEDFGTVRDIIDDVNSSNLSSYTGTSP